MPLNQSKAKPHAYKIEQKFAKNIYEYANKEVPILTSEKPVIAGQIFNINLVCEYLFQNKFQIKNNLHSYVSPMLHSDNSLNVVLHSKARTNLCFYIICFFHSKVKSIIYANHQF